jgi:glycerol-3-phosphate acyltransferase PlsY
MMTSLALILAAYFIGGIPSAYIAGRALRGIDIREYGSGSVSGSNVLEHVGRAAFLGVAAFDILKSAVPTWLALQLGLGSVVAWAVGIAAVLGHDFSPYLRFTGGRGLGAMVGVLAVLTPLPGAVLIVVFVLGIIVRQGPLATAIGMVGLPIFAWLLGQPTLAILGCAALAAITFVKRVVSNTGLPRWDAAGRRVLVNRLLFDRDIRDAEAWMHRRP